MQDTTTTPDHSQVSELIAESQDSTHKELDDVEGLTKELKRLLVNHESTLNEEGIHHEVEVLERWMESYRRGLTAAAKISETGMDWLEHLRKHLKLAADELIRLEGEGGNPASKEQAHKTEALLSALDRIEKVIPDIQNIFKRPPIVESANA